MTDRPAQNDILDRHQIIEIVCRLAAEQVNLDPATVTLETRFIEDLNYDSLDVFEFVMNSEEEFDIHIPEETAETAKTVGQAMEAVMEGLLHRGEQAKPGRLS